MDFIGLERQLAGCTASIEQRLNDGTARKFRKAKREDPSMAAFSHSCIPGEIMVCYPTVEKWRGCYIKRIIIAEERDLYAVVPANLQPFSEQGPH